MLDAPPLRTLPPRQVIERVRLKAATFGQDLGSSSDGSAGGSSSYKVRPEVVAALYEQWVMPLTKQVEVRRRGDECFIWSHMSAAWQGCLGLLVLLLRGASAPL